MEFSFRVLESSFSDTLTSVAHDRTSEIRISSRKGSCFVDLHADTVSNITFHHHPGSDCSVRFIVFALRGWSSRTHWLGQPYPEDLVLSVILEGDISVNLHVQDGTKQRV